MSDRLSGFGIIDRKRVERWTRDVYTETLRQPWPKLLRCDTFTDLFCRELTLYRIVELGVAD